MRRFAVSVLLFVLIVTVIVPYLIARGCSYSTEPQLPQRIDDDTVAVSLYINATGELITLPLETYVAGVVAAEMPATFHVEALKAGAVTARTYVVKRLRSEDGPGCDRHAQADICDDPAHHQAWVSLDDLRRRWGFWSFPRLWSKVVKAVTGTEGLIITYNGEPIDALYHSTCGGRTEAAADVWGEEVAYLKSVICHWDRHSPKFQSQFSFTMHDLSRRLHQEGEIAVVSTTTTGRARTVKVGSQLIPAADIRAELALPSTWFTVHSSNNNVVVDVRGYGHGVGMCQYGADGMARDGAEFMDILIYYYSGVQLEWMNKSNSYGHQTDNHRSD